jgi:hypothetical protein
MGEKTTERKQNQDKLPNEGEGSRSGARAYNEATREFVKSGKVEEKAKEAKRAVEGSDAEKLRQAEREGASHAKEEDPQLHRK